MQTKKILISAVFLIGFGAYAVYAHSHAVASDSVTIPDSTQSSGNTDQIADTGTVTPGHTSAGSETINPGSVSGSSSSSSSSSGSATQTSTTYKNGTYTGSVVSTVYGDVQVSATISGGKITKVTPLKYPNDRHESIEINTRSMPMLVQEAITAQTATVDIVSGATQSSEGFQQTLASALSQAQA